MITKKDWISLTGALDKAPTLRTGSYDEAYFYLTLSLNKQNNRE